VVRYARYLSIPSRGELGLYAPRLNEATPSVRPLLSRPLSIFFSTLMSDVQGIYAHKVV
jgi:hypothetical protein